MTRRRSKSTRPKRIDGALIVVQPGRGVVERTAAATAEAREFAQAKRTVERAMMKAGTSKRQACVTVAAMAPADILAEAASIRATTADLAPDRAPLPACTSRPWWRRIFARLA